MSRERTRRIVIHTQGVLRLGRDCGVCKGQYEIFFTENCIHFSRGRGRSHQNVSTILARFVTGKDNYLDLLHANMSKLQMLMFMRRCCVLSLWREIFFVAQRSVWRVDSVDWKPQWQHGCYQWCRGTQWPLLVDLWSVGINEWEISHMDGWMSALKSPVDNNRLQRVPIEHLRSQKRHTLFHACTQCYSCLPAWLVVSEEGKTGVAWYGPCVGCGCTATTEKVKDADSTKWMW